MSDQSAEIVELAQKIIEVATTGVEPTPLPPPSPEPEEPPTNPVVDKVGETLKLVSPIMTGKAVTAMQKRLIAHGYVDIEADSWFRAGDERAVKDFQDKNGLKADGIVEASTWAALLAMSILERRKEVLSILRANGWAGAPSDTQAIKDFQAAYAFGPALTVDGVPGPKTYAAVLEFKAKGAKLSPNFTALEMQCRCRDQYPDCRRVFVKRSLLLALEKLRAKHYPLGLRVVSGARCEKHNASLKNAYPRSQHRYGRGCDIEPKLSVEQVKALGVFSGIGYNRTTKKVVHVDVRGDSGPDYDNFPYGSKTTPREFPE